MLLTPITWHIIVTSTRPHKAQSRVKHHVRKSDQITWDHSVLVGENPHLGSPFSLTAHRRSAALILLTILIISLLGVSKSCCWLNHYKLFWCPVPWNEIDEEGTVLQRFCWLGKALSRSDSRTGISHCHTPLFANHSSRHQTVAKASQQQLATFT